MQELLFSFKNFYNENCLDLVNIGINQKLRVWTFQIYLEIYFWRYFQPIKWHRTKYCQNAPLCNRMMMMSSPAPRCDVIRLGSIPENNSQMRIENNVGHIVLAAPPPVLTPPNSQGCVFTRFLCVLNGILLPKLFWPTVRKKMF